MSIRVFIDEGDIKDKEGNIIGMALDKIEATMQPKKKLNPHSMCAGKVALLEIFAREGTWLYVKQGDKVLRGSKTLSSPDKSNAYAGVMVHFKLVESGGRRTGLYRITPKGLRFLQGKLRVPRKLWVRGGVVQEYLRDWVYIQDVENVKFTKGYYDRYFLEQKPDGSQGLMKRK